MRKYNILIGLIILIVITMFGCTLAKPEKTIVLNLAAQNVGFLLAQEKPELAQEILEFTKGFLGFQSHNFTKSNFQNWSAWVIGRLDIDPFLEMNFKEMVKLVNIEIALSDSDQETVELLYHVIGHFVIGIEAGK